MARVYRQDLEIVPGFKLVKPLGRGGFGEVWKASAPGGTMAAIKIISLGERSGYKELRAVQLVKQVRHPNLVPINAFWLLNREGEIVSQIREESMVRRAQDLDLIMAMGLGDMNLLDRLRQCQEEGKGGIPAEELLNYMEDAARAIDFLNQPIHDLEDGKGGIQHCDIKPQNILIVGGAAQVCDFGLARVLGDSRITSAKGSAAYMSPEMISDNKPSSRSDQYSLAISYVELRTGRLPVNMSSPAAAIYAHVQGQLDLTRLRPQENAVIKKATEVDPDKRYPTTIEMVRALRAACTPGAGGSMILGPVGLKPEDHLADGMEVVPGYKLLRKLGQGGYGQVWEAAAPGGKRVALKIIRNLEGSQGQQEFRALELIKQVDHNHLMELHAYWLIDKHGLLIADDARDKPDAPRASTLVIASKLASKNLLQRLHECEAEGRAGIPAGELLDYMRESAEAIDYLNAPLHDLGDRKVSIQHRDIKPENILIAAGVVKVGDFGLAKVVEGTSALIHGDSAGLTLAYAAPEMFANRVTSWSDQYCLALTYFKLRTGEFPFPPGCRPSDVIKRHVNGKLDLRRLSEPERVVIARATAITPEQRYASCKAMIADLARALQHVGAGDDPLLPTRFAAAGEVAERQVNQPAPASDKARSSGTALEQEEQGKENTDHDHRDSSHETESYPPKLDTPADLPAKNVPAALDRTSVEEAPGEDRTLGPRTFVKPQSGPEHIRGDSGKEEHVRADSSQPASVIRPKRPLTRSLPAWKDDTPERNTIEQVRRAHWKDKDKDKSKAKDKSSPGGTIPLRWVLGLLFLLALAAAGGVGYWQRWDLKVRAMLDRTDELVAESKQLSDRHEYGLALDKLDSTFVRAEAAAAARQSIQLQWTKRAEEQLDAKHYEQAALTAAALLARFPDDRRAQDVRDKAQRVVDLDQRLTAFEQGKGQDEPATLASQFNGLPEDVRGKYRERLQHAWLERAKKELDAEHFDKAKASAAALKEFDSSEQAAAIVSSATAALEIQRLIAAKDFEKAGALLTASMGKLSEAVHKRFLDTIIEGASKNLPTLAPDTPYDKVVEATGKFLQSNPGNPAALKLRSDAGHAQVKAIEASLEQVAAGDPSSEQGFEMLKGIVRRAKALDEALQGSPYKNVADRADSHVRAEAFRLIGEAHELMDDPTGAFSAYGYLSNPAKAQPEQLKLLLSRIEFLFNPRWDKYRGELGISAAHRVDDLAKFTQRAIDILDEAGAGPELRARTYADRGLAHAARSLQNLPPDVVEGELRSARDAFNVALRTLEQHKLTSKQSWRWRFELAQVLWRQRFQSNQDKRELAKQAIPLLQESIKTCPAAEKAKVLQTLKEIEQAIR